MAPSECGSRHVPAAEHEPTGYRHVRPFPQSELALHAGPVGDGLCDSPEASGQLPDEAFDGVQPETTTNARPRTTTARMDGSCHGSRRQPRAKPSASPSGVVDFSSPLTMI